MKITVSKEITPELLGERKTEVRTLEGSEPESEDGMRKGYSYTIYHTYYGTIDNPIKNSDGTYTYDFRYRVDSTGNGSRSLDPENKKYDLERMVESLLLLYGIHEFKTDVGEKKEYSIKDYFINLDAESNYYKKHNMAWVHYTYFDLKEEKNAENYPEEDDPRWKTLWGNQVRIKAESIEELNNRLAALFTKRYLVYYLFGIDIKITSHIKLGYDGIQEGETVYDYLRRISIQNPQYTTLDEALEKGAITLEDVESVVREWSELDSTQVSFNTLNQLFEKDPELIKNFNEDTIPVDLKRKYNPDFDILKISPSDLIPDDLDALLKKIDERHAFLCISNEKELSKGYIEYFESFLGDAESLRKIIPVIAASPHYYIQSEALEFVRKVSPEVLQPSEVRDLVLQNNLGINHAMSYNFEYDEASANRLLEILSDPKQQTSLCNLNNSIDIMKKFGIQNEKILQALRKSGFYIFIGESEEEVERFKSFEIKGITFDDLQERIMKEKRCGIFRLSTDMSAVGASRGFDNLIKKLEEDPNYCGEEKYETIFNFITNFTDSYEVLSRLTPEVKQMTKAYVIDNIDRIKCLQGKSVSYNDRFRWLMYNMSKGFELSDEDLTNIYIKCFNNGSGKKSIFEAMEEYIPEERRPGFEQRINDANIYPNPKYNWLRDKYLVRIPIDPKKYTIGTIRNWIKQDIQGRCFSTKITTDAVGQKDGKRIPVNNLSKWLFGVPGKRGFLTVTRAGDCIQMPINTPREAQNLINEILFGKIKDNQ